ALYAEGCVHRSAPFRQPYRGRAGVREYLVGAFADESGVVEVRFGTPVVDGDRGSVEYWATLLDRDGAPVTLAGSAFAHFGSDGLITETRDYWHETSGHVPPPDSSGTAATPDQIGEAVVAAARARSEALVA